MDIYKKIDNLCAERSWTIYELCKKANISKNAIYNSRKRNNDLSISTLESICGAFGMTLSQFFSDSNIPVELSEEQQELLSEWNLLNEEQKKAVYQLIKSM